jgi:hypothetical protein
MAARAVRARHPWRGGDLGGKQEGGGGHKVDEVMADLQARLDDEKRRAAQRAGR